MRPKNLKRFSFVAAKAQRRNQCVMAAINKYIKLRQSDTKTAFLVRCLKR
jgi:hypothetical protein